MGLLDVQAAIETVVGRVEGVRKVEGGPVFVAGRTVPLATVMYDGFIQVPGADGAMEMQWHFVVGLWLPLEGRDPGPVWSELLVLVQKVLTEFREDPGLGGKAWIAWPESGRPEVDIPADSMAKPKWIGHTFMVTAKTEEA